MDFSFVEKYDIRDDEHSDAYVSEALEIEGLRECEFVYSSGRVLMVILNPLSLGLRLYDYEYKITNKCAFNPYDIPEKNYADLIVPNFYSENFLLVTSRGEVVDEIPFGELPEYEELTNPVYFHDMYREDGPDFKRVFR